LGKKSDNESNLGRVRGKKTKGQNKKFEKEIFFKPSLKIDSVELFIKIDYDPLLIFSF